MSQHVRYGMPGAVAAILAPVSRGWSGEAGEEPLLGKAWESVHGEEHRKSDFCITSLCGNRNACFPQQEHLKHRQGSSADKLRTWWHL
jgi:hypothetical protein